MILKVIFHLKKNVISTISFGSMGALQFYFVVAIMFKSLLFRVLSERGFLSRLIYMFSVKSLKMINFCKNTTCPASQNLLAFQKGEAPPEQSEFIRRHLAHCEFCAVEVEFYARFPQSEELCPETTIPLPLYDLAEALLGSRKKNYTLLNKLLKENESLTLEKA